MGWSRLKHTRLENKRTSCFYCSQNQLFLLPENQLFILSEKPAGRVSNETIWFRKENPSGLRNQMIWVIKRIGWFYNKETNWSQIQWKPLVSELKKQMFAYSKKASGLSALTSISKEGECRGKGRNICLRSSCYESLHKTSVFWTKETAVYFLKFLTNINI